MGKQHGAQKFIGRNRPPRVEIECDEECYGAQIKVNLPFVAGVMADLSGQWDAPEDVPREHHRARGELKSEPGGREFLEISQDNFEERMKAMKPTAVFTVPNTLTGEGNLSVNLSFESMEDFAPDKVAERLEPLRGLLETRKALKYLQGMAQSKEALKKVVEKLVAHPELMKAVVAVARSESAAPK